jgi:CDP-glycerol glycerophosphotransferase (TagB/SpsB family)
MNKHENKVIPAPDRINTIGKANEKLLHKYGSYSRDKIRTSCALRFHFPSASELFQRRNTKRLLVALRGNRYQAIDLTNFVYTGLKDASQYNVIIRPHPLLPLKKFKSELVFDYVSSSNFLPSDTAAIKQELQTVDIVIYEGSAVAIEALALGIPIIHVDLDDVTNWDPLFECEHFRWSITQEDALLRTVKAIYSLDDNEYHHQQALSRQYIADLANEANEQGLDEFII